MLKIWFGPAWKYDLCLQFQDRKTRKRIKQRFAMQNEAPLWALENPNH